MHLFPKIIFASLALIAANTSIAQETESADDTDQLKLAALEALMAAPSERALPIVKKVLAGDHSEEVKSRALFVLSQTESPEAQTILLDIARSQDGDLQLEAIRMIGISGDPEALAALRTVYSAGDVDVKENVLHAYLIADDSDSVYEIAANAADDEEFETAVNVLGLMGAVEELLKLRGREGSSESLIHAYAMAGEYEPLRELAVDNSNPERQMQAIHGLSIVGGEQVGSVLMEVYRGTEDEGVKEAAMHALMVTDQDQGVLELYRESQDTKEKSELLRILVLMDSDAAMQVIDEALDGG
jgi:HEAT repeat protein